MIPRARLTLLMALATALLFCSTATLALPRPAALEPAIAFWTDIYTELRVNEGVIHDTDESMRVIGRVDVDPPPHWQARRQQVRAALDQYRGALRALADQSMEPATPLQAQLLTRLPADMTSTQALALADRVRFQGGLRERFLEGLIRSGRWRAHIQQVLEEYGVPQALVALPHVESSFNPLARSHAGAAGLWQFTAGTGRRFMRIDPVLDERLDPWESSRAAAQLLAYNYEQIGSWPLAITAYNHGLNGMRRAASEVGTKDYLAIRRQYDGPRFGFASRNFYPALLAAADVDANARRYFGDISLDPREVVAKVTLPHYTPVSTLVESLPVDEATLQAFNPALGPAVWDGRKFIPAGYALTLPAEGQSAWDQAVAALPPSRVYRGQRPDVAHRIVAGDTLSQIASRYGVSQSALMARNGLSNAHRIRAGQQLMLPVAGAMPTPVGGRHYEVRPGDTLGAIAARHGVASQRLAAINRLTDPDRLRVGQRLLIDASGELAAVDTVPEP